MDAQTEPQSRYTVAIPASLRRAYLAAIRITPEGEGIRINREAFADLIGARHSQGGGYYVADEPSATEALGTLLFAVAQGLSKDPAALVQNAIALTNNARSLAEPLARLGIHVTFDKPTE